MTVTTTNEHYLGVSATVAQVNAAFDTQITTYTTTYSITLPGGRTITSTVTEYGALGGWSVPASVGADISTVTGLGEFDPKGTASASSDAALGVKGTAGETVAPRAGAASTPQQSKATAADSGSQCSQRRAGGGSSTAPWTSHRRRSARFSVAATGRTAAPTVPKGAGLSASSHDHRIEAGR